MFAGLEVGLGLIIIATVLFLSVLFVVLLRRLPRNSLLAPDSVTSFVSTDTSNSNESILIIQPGGRVEYLNDVARELFGLRSDEPTD
ncbi:MAG TPA: hypothetical protein VFQ23_12615, partial [Anaerolineales bacterium]|nr:hypothetical protein [Anaerolineales bacterium]